MGLVHGYCPKTKISPIAFFRWNYVRKHRFFDIYKKRTNHFKTKKSNFNKGQKISGFEISGWFLDFGFGPKLEVFLMGVFYRNHFRKHRFWYWGTKRMILRGKKKVLKRAKKFTFFKGDSPWICSKNRTFSYGRFSQKSYQKTSFLILWKEKNDFKRKKIKVLKRAKKWTFLDQKIEVSKRANTWIFFKGVGPWIFSKNRTFTYRRFSQKSF